MIRRLVTPARLIILSGLVFGALAAVLARLGNPPNMGICAACFLRDIAGALGLHRAGAVQYIRPEIIGFVLGSFLAAYAFREFRARGGSAPLARFLLGALVMIGALVFLGCPIRATLRLAGGDLNGITGLAGLVAGVLVGIYFLKRGFNLGRSARLPVAMGWIMPVAMFGLLLLAIFTPGFIFSSEKGAGAQHAPLIISLVVGGAVGILGQRTRLCFVGGWRDIFLVKDTYLFSGVAAFFLAALVFNLFTGQFHLGFQDQPIAHSNHLWNFFGMVVVGLGSALLGGCPLRQLVLSGEGDTDAAMTVLGLVFGAAIAHNFGLASSAKGPSTFGPWAVVIGLLILIAIGFLLGERITLPKFKSLLTLREK